MTVIYTATVNTKTYGFDYADQRIDVDATIDNMLVTDLWTAIKEAQAVVEGMAYDQIASGSGNDTLGTGIETFLTVTLLDNWEVNSLKLSGKFEVSGGNLIREDQADPFRDNPLITYIAFLSQAGIATTVAVGSAVLPQDIVDIADAVWDEVISTSDHNIAQSAGKRLRQAARSLSVEGTVNDPTPSASSFISDLTNSVDNFYKDQVFTFISGSLEGQSRIVTSYNGTTKTFTFDEVFTSAPADGDEFEIQIGHVHPISQIAKGIIQDFNF